MSAAAFSRCCFRCASSCSSSARRRPRLSSEKSLSPVHASSSSANSMRRRPEQRARGAARVGADLAGLGLRGLPARRCRGRTGALFRAGYPNGPIDKLNERKCRRGCCRRVKSMTIVLKAGQHTAVSSRRSRPVHPSPSPRPQLEQQHGLARWLDCWGGGYTAGCLATPRLPPTQAEKALFNAAIEGDLATLTRLVEEGVDLEATDNVDDEDQVSATSPASNPIPLCPRCPLPLLAPPSPRVCRRRRASVEELHGPHVCG